MEEIQNIPKCKVVCLGESGVGKTSIISILLNKAFNEKDEAFYVIREIKTLLSKGINPQEFMDALK